MLEFRLGLTMIFGARKLKVRYLLLPACVVLYQLVPNGAMAQEVPGVRETIYRSYLERTDLVKGGIVEPEWLSDGVRFLYSETGSDGTVTYEYNPVTKSRKLAENERERIEIKSKPEPREVGHDMFGLPMLEMLSPDGRWFVHRRDHDLWLRQPDSDTLIRLTNDGAKGHEWGEAFEWDEGTGRPWAFWSPDGSTFAVRKVDDRLVPNIPVVTYEHGRPELRHISFPRPGEPLPKRELYLISIPDGRILHVEDNGDPERHIRAVGWNPDGSEFLYMTLNRSHKRLRLLAADALTGSTRELIVEDRQTFHSPLWSSPPQFIPIGDGEHFLWTSDRNGWRHIYLYHRSGRLIRQLTRGSFPVHHIVSVDEDRSMVYFMAHPDQERPYDLHLCSVGIESGNYRQLTTATGYHNIEMAPSHQFFLDTHSSIDRPHVTELRHADGGFIDTLSTADITALENIGWTTPEEVVVTAVDGKTRLYGVLYKPYDFDPQKRYPVVEYIYDGYWTTVVSRSFSRPGNALDSFPLDNIDPLVLAQMGFLVWVVDGRGSSERGRTFRDFAYGGLFDPIPDHVAALRQMAASRPYVDLARVGIFGISAGGGQTLEALFKAPETYHVGIAIAAGVDPLGLRADGVELIYGSVEDNPKAYNNKLIALADKLQGHLMLMHGTDDSVVPFTHTMQMVNALVASGIPHDLVLIPGQNHGFYGAGARYAREKLKNYFIQHLRN